MGVTDAATCSVPIISTGSRKRGTQPPDEPEEAGGKQRYDNEITGQNAHYGKGWLRSTSMGGADPHAKPCDDMDGICTSVLQDESHSNQS